MRCREVAEFLMEYEAHSLAPEVHREFELHLVRCEDCRVFIVQYQETVRAGQKVCSEHEADTATEIPEELCRAIMAAIRAQKI